MYLKKLKAVILAAIIAAIFCSVAGFWIFEMDYKFLPFPLLAGFAIVFVQKEKTSYKFLDKLLIGALLFGFSTLLLIYARMYLISNFIYNTDFPFWPLYNLKEYLIFSLVFSFVSFLGGLAGIVIKGFFSIFHVRIAGGKKF